MTPKPGEVWTVSVSSCCSVEVYVIAESSVGGYWVATPEIYAPKIIPSDEFLERKYPNG